MKTKNAIGDANGTVDRGTFICEYEGNDSDVYLDERGHLTARNGLVFLRMNYRPDVKTPAQFPAIQHGSNIHLLISSAATLPEAWTRDVHYWLGRDVTENGRYCLPDAANDWTADSGKAGLDQIVEALAAYDNALRDARTLDDAKALLDRERGNPDFYASAHLIDDLKPTMVAGLMLHRGVSVFYGPKDEFKSTFATDLAAHVSTGARWQGLATTARPVLWYALEGADGVKARLKVLEGRLIGKDTPWGNHALPFTVRERIPSDPREWRQAIDGIDTYWDRMQRARRLTGDLPRGDDGDPLYPYDTAGAGNNILIVIDQLSLALDGEDEKGHKAAGFIRKCLDLTIRNDELASGDDPDFPTWPVASHVLILAHSTKAGDEIAGHRAIASDTHGLYRIRRFGRFGDQNRPYTGELRPERVKDMPPPAPMPFEVEIVQVPSTQQTTTVLKDRASELSKDLLPVIDALRKVADQAEMSSKELNDCLDLVAAKGEKGDGAKRQARKRLREKLEQAGVLEPVEDDSGSVKFYRFHDGGVTL